MFFYLVMLLCGKDVKLRSMLMIVFNYNSVEKRDMESERDREYEG